MGRRGLRPGIRVSIIGTVRRLVKLWCVMTSVTGFETGFSVFVRFQNQRSPYIVDFRLRLSLHIGTAVGYHVKRVWRLDVVL